MTTLQQRINLLSPLKKRRILKRFNEMLDFELNPPTCCTYAYREPGGLKWECMLKYDHSGECEMGLS
jgi:hypothetical protein